MIKNEIAKEELIEMLDCYQSLFICCEEEYLVVEHLVAQDTSHYNIEPFVYIKVQCPKCKTIYHAILRVEVRPLSIRSVLFESDEEFAQLLDTIKNCIASEQIDVQNISGVMRVIRKNYAILRLLRSLSPDTIKYVRPCVNKGMAHFANKTEEHIAYTLDQLTSPPTNRCLPYLIDRINSPNIKCSLDELYGYWYNKGIVGYHGK